MAKRLAAVCLALLYTVTILGVVLNLHYCFDQVASVKINAPVQKCTTAQAAKAMNCCKDKHVDIKVKDGHQSSSSFTFTKLFVADLPVLSFYSPSAVCKEAYATSISYRGPPGGNKSSLYLANCNFRI